MYSYGIVLMFGPKFSTIYPDTFSNGGHYVIFLGGEKGSQEGMSELKLLIDREHCCVSVVVERQRFQRLMRLAQWSCDHLLCHKEALSPADAVT